MSELQPEIEDDDGSTCIMWKRGGKTYAFTTLPNGLLVATVSPFNPETPPMILTVEAMRDAIDVAWQEFHKSRA